MSDFWIGKKVLVTGHTGFVGAWLTCVLQDLGAEVTGFSLEEEAGSLYGKIREKLPIKSVYGDLRNEESIRSCVEKADPEIIFHLAAFGFVKECLSDPQRAYTCNVLGTVHLFQAIRNLQHPVRIVLASSDKVYRNDGAETRLFTENDPLGGSDPYSASKTCEDLAAQSYYETYLKESGSSLCIVRPSNILGGGDHIRSRLIPGLFDSISRGERPVLRNPASVRPWQHILDMTDAYLTLAQKCGSRMSVYNVGPEPAGIRSVAEITEVILRLYGMESDTSVVPSAGHEKTCLGLAVDKIRREIGWKPQKTLEQTLEDIYRFYNEDDGSNTYELCLSQIREYYLTLQNGEDHGTVAQ